MVLFSNYKKKIIKTKRAKENFYIAKLWQLLLESLRPDDNNLGLKFEGFLRMSLLVNLLIANVSSA